MGAKDSYQFMNGLAAAGDFAHHSRIVPPNNSYLEGRWLATYPYLKDEGRGNAYLMGRGSKGLVSIL